MDGMNRWGGPFEVHGDLALVEDERSRNLDYDPAALPHSQPLDQTQQSWLLCPQENVKKKKYVDLGCIVCSRKAFKWSVLSVLIAFVVIALPTIIVKTLPKHKPHPLPHDNYTVAVEKALKFFHAQKSGVLPKNNGVSWRGNSGLTDGSDAKANLVGGYYDGGDNVKYHFPMSYAMTMLSWSVIEYSHKYKAINEYDNVRELIKWGTDYLLQTFNISARVPDHIYCQVGGTSADAVNSTNPSDLYCWMKPENMNYPRQTHVCQQGPDLGGEMAAALAAASIVFRDDLKYHQKLIKGATAAYNFARDGGKRARYSTANLLVDHHYNSTGYYDEYMWGAAWMYYATGNVSYLSLATNPGISKNSKAFYGKVDLSVPSWDNKLPAAQLLLTRLRIFLNPGYPYEDMLRMYQNTTGLNMCSYLRTFKVFNWTRGGMIELNHGNPQNLQNLANTAFLASLYVDYMNATGVPGFFCGPNYISSDKLTEFATSQIQYILGDNPMKMSYLVGYGSKYPRHVYHRAASIPTNQKPSCTGGWKWRDSPNKNPNDIIGAMVAGPDKFDRFKDVRSFNSTEPTMAGNAALVAALISLTSSGGYGIDKNTIFSAVPPLYPMSPPPPPPWKP